MEVEKGDQIFFTSCVNCIFLQWNKGLYDEDNSRQQILGEGRLLQLQGGVRKW